MQLNKFLTASLDISFWQHHSVFSFTGSTYPLLFFALLRFKLKKLTASEIRTINTQEIRIDQFKAQVEIAPFGLAQFLFLDAIDELDTKYKKQLIALLNNYHGPHHIIYFSLQEIEKIPSQACTIVFPDVVDEFLLCELGNYFYPGFSQKKKALVKRMLSIWKGKCTVEQACRLIEYSNLLTLRNLDEFVHEWLEIIMVPEQSLFLLSTYFFAKKTKEFLIAWHKIAPTYPTQFWLSYWSDQLFRASCFVQGVRTRNFLLAKKIAYRLPFSFIKQDWRLYSKEELASAHNSVYELDYHIKNGAHEKALENFYVQFLSNKFKS